MRGGFRCRSRFTSYGDLATPNTNWVLPSPQSKFAVAAVEQFQPLFHLLNGDLCYANLNPTQPPEVWRDFGNNAQDSAANRAWMPCPGNHELEFHNGPQGLDSYLTRYSLPDNGTRFSGRWSSRPSDNTYDTSHGTIHLIFGGGGTSAPLDVYGVDAGNGLPQAKVFTKPNRPIPGTTAGTFVRNAADALEDAIWSAQRDTGTGYGIAVFDVDPGQLGGSTKITMNYYHAPGADTTPTPDYQLFETIVLETRR